MIVGKLYRLTERAKASMLKIQARYKYGRVGLDLYSEGIATIGKVTRTTFPIETLVVPLELHRTTITGKPLSGDSSRRIIVLLSTGDMGTMYVDINDWEEVC